MLSSIWVLRHLNTLITVNILISISNFFFYCLLGAFATLCDTCPALRPLPRVFVCHYWVCEGEQVLSPNCDVEEAKKTQNKKQCKTTWKWKTKCSFPRIGWEFSPEKTQKNPHLATDTMTPLSPEVYDSLWICWLMCKRAIAAVHANTLTDLYRSLLCTDKMIRR